MTARPKKVAAQFSADCANARVLRSRWSWLAGLGIVLGSAIVWPRGPRGPVGPAVRPSAGADPRRS